MSEQAERCPDDGDSVYSDRPVLDEIVGQPVEAAFYSPKLLPHHAELLHRSAISPEVANHWDSHTGLRYESITERPRLYALGFSPAQLVGVPGLLIRSFRPDGEKQFQFRPDTPRKSRGPNPRLIKYECPPKQPIHLDMPRGELLADRSKPLIVTEGARKVDAAITAGYAAVGLFGVTMWRCPDWMSMSMSGRHAVIIFDSDAATNKSVRVQEIRLASYLRKLGARVSIARIPAGEDGSKVGLDDFLYSGGMLDMLIAEADETRSSGTDGPEADEKRAPLNVTNDADLFDWLHTELGKAVPGLFLRGGLLVRVPSIGEDGYQPPNHDRDDDGPAQVHPVDGRTLRTMLSRRYWTFKVVKRGDYEDEVHALPASSPCDMAVTAAAESQHVPRLAGVVHTPLVLKDGNLLTEPGYDRASRLLYLPNGLEVPPLPARPTKNDVSAARELLLYLVRDFPFISDGDRANFLGALLMPLLRIASPGLRPLIVINAPMPGSGKSLLAQIMRVVHGGVIRSELPGDDDELRKSITGILMTTTGPVVQFDNVTKVLRSGQLAALLTSETWSDRLLGRNENPVVPNDRLWVVTGNNIKLGGDLPRRAMWCTIDANRPNPWERKGFAEGDLIGWATEHRGEILRALLVLVQAWVRSGAKRTPTRDDNFAHLATRVGGVLMRAGIPGEFWASETDQTPVGVDDTDWGDFLTALESCFDATPFTAKEVVHLVATSDLEDSFPVELADKLHRGGSVTRSLGKWFGNRAGRFAGSLKIESAGHASDGSTKLWKVVRAE